MAKLFQFLSQFIPFQQLAVADLSFPFLKVLLLTASLIVWVRAASGKWKYQEVFPLVSDNSLQRFTFLERLIFYFIISSTTPCT